MAGAGAVAFKPSKLASKRHPAISHLPPVKVTVLQLRPERVMEVIHPSVQRFVVASDAALEVPFQGTGGFLIIWFNGHECREAFVSHMPRSLYSLFTPGAQLELIQFIFALTARPHLFRSR